MLLGESCIVLFSLSRKSAHYSLVSIQLTALIYDGYKVACKSHLLNRPNGLQKAELKQREILFEVFWGCSKQ